MNPHEHEWIAKAKNYGGRVLGLLQDTLRPLIAENVLVEPTNQIILDNFLKTNKINVYIDDLDRGWQGKRNDISRISALLNALRDLSTENPGLNFRVALRSDVYFLVRTSDESTDKIEGSVVWQTWSNHHILALLVKRIETFFGRPANEQALLSSRPTILARYLEPVMEPRFTGRGKWEKAPMHRVLMSLIRKRPRDLVKLCSLAATKANEHRRRKISTSDFQAIFEQYSQGRLQDTVNEFRTELPSIEALLMGMKPNKKERLAALSFVYKTDALINKIHLIMEHERFQFANGRSADATELAQFLYKINFLTARKELPTGEIQRKYFEEHRYIYGKFADFGFEWEVHPAYRWALQPDDLDSIFAQLDLSVDEF